MGRAVAAGSESDERRSRSVEQTHTAPVASWPWVSGTTLGRRVVPLVCITSAMARRPPPDATSGGDGGGGWDVIDLDPCGSVAELLPSALGCLADGGLLLVRGRRGGVRR